MGRKYQKKQKQSKQKKQGEEYTVSLNREVILEMIREGLNQFGQELGLTMVYQFLKEEVARLCGLPYERVKERKMSRHGEQSGYVMIGGQKLPLKRPRVRYVDGGGEVEIPLYRKLQDPETMSAAVLRRLVRGVSCRDYEEVIDKAREGFGVSKSSVSREFVRGTEKALESLLGRRLDEKRYAAIFIDGVEYAGETIIVVLGLEETGKKEILGLRQGATENAEVCTALLEEIRDRGLPTNQVTLFVLDGSKALVSGVKKVFGEYAFIQRCQEHKKRNVKAHIPERYWTEVRKRLQDAYNHTDYEKAKKILQNTVEWLERINPDAAASLREGLEETLTVVRLGVDELLRRSLSSTNPVESCISVTRTVTRRVKRWKGGTMRQRWCAAGLLRAEEKFRRVKGYRSIPKLIRTMEGELAKKRLDSMERTA